jgi:inhibitor of cysteine peptidase
MAVIQIDERHGGTRVEAQAGDTIELVLPENATTGYRWEIDEPDGPLAVQTSEARPAGDAKPGAGGQRHVVVQATGPGSGRLSLRLRRSWEPPEQADETYAVDVNVT